jgi:hypothetical protein
MAKKYYCGEIINHVGERDITTTVFFKTSANPKRKLKKIARIWWGEDTDATLTSSGPCWELSKATFDEMTVMAGSLVKLRSTR